MKKTYFLLFMFVFSININAQIRKQTVFDFNQPLSFSPEIVTSPENNTSFPLEGVYTIDDIQIAFEHDIQYSPGSRITTNIVDGEYEYDVRVATAAYLKFHCLNEAVLDSIYFDVTSDMGGLCTGPDQPGMQNTSLNLRAWGTWLGGSDYSENVTDLTFYNISKSAHFSKFTVFYNVPAASLKPVSNIDTSSEIYAFEGFVLTFDKEVKLVEGKDITISSVDGTIVHTFNSSVEGKVVTLSLLEALTAKGDYVITIPEHAFETEEGFYNKEIVYSVTITRAKNTLMYESVLPEDGTYLEKISSNINITFPEEISPIESDKAQVRLFKVGKDSPVRSMKLIRSESNAKVAELLFLNEAPDVTDEGEYYFEIEEGVIYDVNKGDPDYETYNPKFKITYHVGSEPEPDPVDSETMIEAKRLLGEDFCGVGYPAADSPSRLVLFNLTQASPMPSDDDLQAAIDAFYAETAIEVPQTDKYYRIAAVTTENTYYLAYQEGAVVLTDSKRRAANFKATASDGKTIFQTEDGKYLHVLSNNTGYDKTNQSNTTEEYDSDVNDLILSKIFVNGVDYKELFGKVSIFGGLGSEEFGSPESAFAFIENGIIKTTSKQTPDKLCYDATKTNAFVITESVESEPVELECELVSTLIDSIGAKLVINFKDVEDLTKVGSKAVATITAKNIDSVEVELVKDAEKDNVYTVALGDLSNGNYTLDIAEGTFLFVDHDEICVNKPITLVFTIKYNVDDMFMTDYSFYQYPFYSSKVLYKTDLNNCGIYKDMYQDDLVADTTKEIRLEDEWNRLISKGHLMPTIFVIGESEVSGYKVVLDNPITEETVLPDGTYHFRYPLGACGDANYRKYLEDSSSIDPSLCNVNPANLLTIHQVSNAGDEILDIKNTSSKKVIFDLSGRRVENITKCGIYIINGKKIIVK